MKLSNDMKTAIEEIVRHYGANANEKYLLLVKILEELPEAQKKQKHWPGMFQPQEEQEYFSANPMDGGFINQSFLNYNQGITDTHRALGICCETKEEADFVIRKKRARLELVDLIAELNEGWRPDWDDEDQKKALW